MTEERGPRATYQLVGHAAEERILAQALAGPRLHHAWLLHGPRHLGKATLAFRVARVALGARPKTPGLLDVDEDDPVARRIEAGAHPDLFVLERGLNERGKLRRDITVDDARRLSGFFSLSSAEGGMRVAIVDAVDDLNTAAANALLKTLEEPPPRCLLLLVSHSPGNALATIRSRCRKLGLSPAEDAQIAALMQLDAGAAYLRLFRGRPGLAAWAEGERREGVLRLAQAFDGTGARKAGALFRALQDSVTPLGERGLALAFEFAGAWIRNRALAGAGPVEAAAWSEAWSALEAIRQEQEALDLDPNLALAQLCGMLDRAGT